MPSSSILAAFPVSRRTCILLTSIAIFINLSGLHQQIAFLVTQQRGFSFQYPLTVKKICNNCSRLELKVSDINPDHKLAVLHNFCLGRNGTQQVFWMWGLTDDELTSLAKMHPVFSGKSLPVLKLMDLEQQATLAAEEESNNSAIDVEWLPDDHNTEYYLYQRSTVDNLFHWLGVGFYQYLFLFDSGGHRGNTSTTFFHIPSLRRFYNLADLSYVQFVQLMGVKEQRTVTGVVQNFSDTHVDEMRDDYSHRMTCFPRGIVAVVSEKERLISGSHPFKGMLRQSFEAFLDQFRRALDVEPPPANCSQTKLVKATIITRPKGTAREIVNMDQVLGELQKREIPFELHDLNGMTFRQQVEFATMNCSIYVAAHGQAMWLTHFLPETAGVVEILPYGFPYPYYVNIAASHGVTNYSQITVDRPWHPATKRMIQMTQSYLRRDATRNDTAIDNIAPELERVLDLLQPKSYKPVTQYFVSELGTSQANADTAAKVLAREQPLLVNVIAVVDAIEAQYWRLLRDCGLSPQTQRR